MKQIPTPLPRLVATATNPIMGDRVNTALALTLGVLLLGAFVLSALNLSSGPLAWSLLRATGVVAYLALAVTVSFGALLGSRYAPVWLVRAQQYGWHGLLSGFALVLGSVHGLFLTVDGRYAQPLRALLIPGTSTFSPLAVGLGTLGLYGLALVYGSTLWRRHLNVRVWRAVHLAAYPSFMLLTVHGLLIGSDGLGLLYGASVAGVALTFGLRFSEETGKRGSGPAAHRMPGDS